MIDSSSSQLVQLMPAGSGIVHLVINRPEAMNALDIPTARSFRQACEKLAEQRDVRAVVLRGTGRGFGAGGDVASMRGDARSTILELIGEMNAAAQLLAQI